MSTKRPVIGPRMRSFTDSVNSKALYNVPLREQALDRRLPTEQMAALRAKLKVVDMRLAKCKDAAQRLKLEALQGRLRSSIQRVADEIVFKQWPRDERWFKAQGQG